jgi:hypothetical protein
VSSVCYQADKGAFPLRCRNPHHLPGLAQPFPVVLRCRYENVAQRALMQGDVSRQTYREVGAMPALYPAHDVGP